MHFQESEAASDPLDLPQLLSHKHNTDTHDHHTPSFRPPGAQETLLTRASLACRSYPSSTGSSLIHLLLPAPQTFTQTHIQMLHLARPISAHERFVCTDPTCKCKLPATPKKVKSTKEDAIPTAWEEVDDSIMEAPLNLDGRQEPLSFLVPETWQLRLPQHPQPAHNPMSGGR